ncbi:PREDICTED: maltase 2-like [Acromyrmex echinatior]|uniref:alpha-glucosidase n=1 Tax=Acromyrmex echinatior TaxID=103372 RepID=F4WA48_ACREC|nr:PREDICTED: maltase 2-like [Acromyrmex echinatior]EGI68925.1 Maltase 2 [Acromyrmex echinatior]
MIRSCILIAALIVLAGSNEAQEADKDWYKNSLVYQIYPRSFKDSNGDGIGDLNGITSKLEHIKDIGADALWMSPIFSSPQKDFGYDISNFTDINEEYGTLNDFKALVQKAQSLGLKVILDFVPNHSSDQHEWFNQSIHRIEPYDEYYVWHDAKSENNITNEPPNNWLSAFGGSAWEWNEIRGQYYLHQFAVGQPDLNYRNEKLREEMQNVLVFWMDLGVKGFRIDAINHMYEDDRFLDEPLSNLGVPSNDYDYLNHIYTKNLPETYDVLKTWRKLMDDHSTGDTKMILTEAYADFDLTIKYYQSGSTVPFNFMFISDLNNKSSAADFKHSIDRWINNMPKGAEYVANWVTGNHDNHRAATRFGEKRADQLSMLATVLPGVSVIYNGDEIGMLDRYFTYNETVDPAGCGAGEERYFLKSRDPERTPFQWDDSISAGFSTNKSTWLPVNDNYKFLNLKAQKPELYSHYNVFKRLTQLKKKPVIEQGTLETALYCYKCSVAENVLGVVRRNETSIVVLIVNFNDTETVIVDISIWLNISEQLMVYTSNEGSNLLIRSPVNMATFNLSGSSSVILVTADLFD